MKEKEIKYKQLFLTFAWQFCLVILTLNIGASILLAIESKAEKNPPRFTKEDLLKNFSLQFNVTVQDLEQLFSELDTLEDLDHNTMTYLEAVMLVVSLFFTIGWGHMIPVTTWGKIFSVLISLLGIPLTFLFLYTGATVFLSILKDVLHILLSYHSHKLTKYGETKINVSTKRNLLPAAIIILVLYFFLTAVAVAEIEDFTYANALWYSFITFTTIGLGDLTQGKIFRTEGVAPQFGQALFIILWLMFGFIISGATLLILFKGSENTKLQEAQLDNKNAVNDVNLVPVDETAFFEGEDEEEPFEKNDKGIRKNKRRWHPIFQ